MPLFRKLALGLDISDRSVEAVLAVRKGNRFLLSSHGCVPLPPGVVVDGFVEKPEAARQALQALLTGGMHPPLPKGVHRVAFALPQSQVYSHLFHVPAAADEAVLGDALALEADDHFPYPHGEMAAGHALVARHPDRKDVHYAAVHRETLKGYVSLLKSVGLVPTVAEGECSSIARTVPPSPAPFLAVDIGARTCDVAHVEGGTLRFSESSMTAGDAFTAAVGDALGVDEAEADALKRGQGLSMADPQGRQALVDSVDRMIGSVIGALETCRERSGRPIPAVLLCGGSSLMPGLIDHVRTRLQAAGHDAAVSLLDPWERLEAGSGMEHLGFLDRDVLAAAAVGLALRAAGLRSSGDINFLSGRLGDEAGLSRAEGCRVPVARAVPSSWPARFRRPPTWLRALAAAVAVTGLAIGAWASASLLLPPKPVIPAGLPDSVSLEARAVPGIGLDPAAGTLPIETSVRELRVQKDVVREFSVSDGFAAGRIEIVNGSASAQTLVARTRFLSEGGVLFRLSERTTVPAKGSVMADVMADAPGSSGDIEPSRFTVPGLPAATQALIHGRSDAAMRGGRMTVAAPFGEEERGALLRQLADDAGMQAQYGLAADEGRIVVPGTARLGAPTVQGVPSVGESATSIHAVAAFRADVAVVRTADVQAFLLAALAHALPSGTQPSDYVLGAPSVEAVTDASGQVVGLKFRAEAHRGS